MDVIPNRFEGPVRACPERSRREPASPKIRLYPKEAFAGFTGYWQLATAALGIRNSGLRARDSRLFARFLAGANKS